MMKNNLGKDFTFWSLLKFAAPSTIMMVFLSMYTMMDGVFVSNYVGANALSAINIVYPVPSIIIAIAVMLATGGSAILAKNMGEGKLREAKENFSLICLLGLIIGVVIAVVGFMFIDSIILALGATDLLYKYCYDYLSILIICTPFSIFQMLFQTFFVTAGKPNVGLAVTFIGGLVNIILDYIFVGILQIGVSGAAVATVIGYSIPAIYGVYYFAKNSNATLSFVKPVMRSQVLIKACTNGSSEMISNLAIAVTTFMFNIIMLRYMGEDGVAAITIVLYAQFLLTSIFIGFSTGVAPIISYNYGENNYIRIRRIFKSCIIFVTIASLLMFAISAIFPDPIVRIFSRPGTNVYDIAMHGFSIFSISFLFAGFNIFSSALFTAFSNGKISALISLLRTFVFLIISMVVLPKLIGYEGVWLSIPLAELLGLIISLICIFRSKNQYHYF